MFRRWSKRLHFTALAFLPIVLGLGIASCFYDLEMSFALGPYVRIGVSNTYFYGETARNWHSRYLAPGKFDLVGPGGPYFAWPELAASRHHQTRLPLEFPRISWAPTGRAYEICGNWETRSTGSLWISGLYPLMLLALLAMPALLTRFRRRRYAAFPVEPRLPSPKLPESPPTPAPR